MRGSYTSAGVELLLKAIKAAVAPLSLAKNKLKLDGGNHMRPTDAEKLVAALTANSEVKSAVRERVASSDLPASPVNGGTVVESGGGADEAAAASPISRDAISRDARTSRESTFKGSSNPSFKEPNAPAPVNVAAGKQAGGGSAAADGAVANATSLQATSAGGGSPSSLDAPAGQLGEASPAIESTEVGTEAGAQGAAPASAEGGGTTPLGTTPRSRDKPGASLMLGGGGK